MEDSSDTALEVRSPDQNRHGSLWRETDEVRLRCFSQARADKEAIGGQLRKRFEEGLEKIAASFAKPNGTRKRDKADERIGCLKKRCRDIGRHYNIKPNLDEKGGKVVSLDWSFEARESSRLSRPGVYCPSHQPNRSGRADSLRTCTMLADLEAVFRSLKSELGMRPVHHRTAERSEGHLPVTGPACQAVQSVWHKPEETGINESRAGPRAKPSRSSGE